MAVDSQPVIELHISPRLLRGGRETERRPVPGGAPRRPRLHSQRPEDGAAALLVNRPSGDNAAEVPPLQLPAADGWPQPGGGRRHWRPGRPGHRRPVFRGSGHRWTSGPHVGLPSVHNPRRGGAPGGHRRLSEIVDILELWNAEQEAKAIRAQVNGPIVARFPGLKPEAW